ncbi:MAG TPA: hypothetical protein VIK97_03200, partial [Casimicrobiaceae bacterium]
MVEKRFSFQGGHARHLLSGSTSARPFRSHHLIEILPRTTIAALRLEWSHPPMTFLFGILLIALGSGESTPGTPRHA